MRFFWLDFWSECKWQDFPRRKMKNLTLVIQYLNYMEEKYRRKGQTWTPWKLSTLERWYVVVHFRLLVPWMLPLTVGSHFGIPFSQQAEYHKAGVESCATSWRSGTQLRGHVHQRTCGFGTVFLLLTSVNLGWEKFFLCSNPFMQPPEIGCLS